MVGKCHSDEVFDENEEYGKAILIIKVAKSLDCVYVLVFCGR